TRRSSDLKMMEAFARLRCTASRTLSKTGTPSTFDPPLPGVTPATTFVPKSIIKISSQRLSGFRLQQHLISAAKCQTAKAIPLGLVEPAFTAGNLSHRFCLSGWIGWMNRQSNGRKALFQRFCGQGSGGDACRRLDFVLLLAHHRFDAGAKPPAAPGTRARLP